MAKYYLKNNCGITGFKMGQDFHNKMKIEDKSVEYMRPAFVSAIKAFQKDNKEFQDKNKILEKAQYAYTRYIQKK